MFIFYYVGTDLFKCIIWKVNVRNREWIWKSPYALYGSPGRNFIQSPSSCKISLMKTRTVMPWLKGSVRLVRLLQKLQFERFSLVCQWRRWKLFWPGGQVNSLEVGGNYVCWLFIVVLVMWLEGAKRWRSLKSSYGGKGASHRGVIGEGVDPLASLFELPTYFSLFCCKKSFIICIA